MSYTLTKSKIMSGLQCKKRLWLEEHNRNAATVKSSVELAVLNGQFLGENARTVLGMGIPSVIIGHTKAPLLAVEETARLLSTKLENSRIIFEAAFLFDGVLVRADALIQDDSGTRMIEVKSSTTVKSYHYQDTAIQAWVIKQSGLRLNVIQIAYINNEFVYQGDANYAGLLNFQDVTLDVRLLADKVPEWVALIQPALLEHEPSIPMGSHCNKPHPCPFMAYCNSLVPDNLTFPVDILPRSKHLVNKLRESGYEDLTLVPEEMLATDQQRKIARISRTGIAELSSRAAELIKDFAYPHYYLDFETVSLAVPRWAKTWPYQNVPFQWSCEVELASGKIEHKEYLDKLSGDDPRPDFCVSLLEAVGKAGTVFVYNATFEKGRLSELADLYPEYSKELKGIQDRIVDLLPITREHYYHPQMKGSWSIKDVIRAIDVKMDYSDLSGVQEGNGAQLAYIKAAITGAIPKDKARETLLTYCKMDTEAMVQLKKFLERSRA